MTLLECVQPETVYALEHLVACGFKPSFILDIGAYEGEWTQLVTQVYKDVPVLMIEANPKKIKLLNLIAEKIGPQVIVKEALLDSIKSDELRIFYLCEGGSSLYKELTSYPKQEIKLTTNTLDDLLKDSKLNYPGLMKIDVQGSELDVLYGGRDILLNVEVVLMECSLLPYNEKAPLFAEIIEFMDRYGFSVYDLAGSWRRQSDGTMYQCDVIFVRNDSKLREYKKFWNNEPEPIKIPEVSNVDELYTTEKLTWPLISGINVIVENKWDWVVFCDIFITQEYPITLTAPNREYTVKILDLGANVGYFSLYVADICKKSQQPFKIYAFEGVTETYKTLTKRIEQYPEIECIQGLIGKKTGTDNIATSLNHGTSIIIRDGKNYPQETVKYVNIEDYIPSEKIDIIKCDIEGSEFDFVENYSELFKRTNIIYMEIHNLCGDPEKLRAKMKEYGFSNQKILDRKTASIEVFTRDT